MARVVLVTGVSTVLGRRFASALAADPSVDRVIGVDVRPPAPDPGPATVAAQNGHQPDETPNGEHLATAPGDNGAADHGSTTEQPAAPAQHPAGRGGGDEGVTFVRADIRSPAIGRMLERHEVDTVVHLGVLPPPVGGRGHAVVKENNVIGSMQLLAACQRLPRVRRLVLRSTTAVYGASSHDPAMFTEEMEPRRMPSSPYAQDSIEVERYVRGFARRRPDVQVSTLRFSSVLGPTIRTALTEYLTLPVVPTALGFDPRLQFTHEDDVVGALLAATLRSESGAEDQDAYGVINISGGGVLTLMQALRRLGRPALPVPPFAFRPLRHAYRAVGWGRVDDGQAAFLTYGRGVDTARMRDELGFDPAYDSAEAFDAFVHSEQLGPLTADRVRAAEQELTDALGVRVPHGR